MRARVTITLLAFLCALTAGMPVAPAAVGATVERTPAPGGETDRTPYLGPGHSSLQLRAAREASARPTFCKLPPHPLALRFVATPAVSRLARTDAIARVPIAPPSAPRSCRGPPRP